MPEVQTTRRRKPRGPYKHKHPDVEYLKGLGLVDDRGATEKVGSSWASLRLKIKPAARFGNLRVYRITDIENALTGHGSAS